MPSKHTRATRRLLFPGALILLLLASERDLKAYTDPGSGALLWQVLVAGLVGALFYIRKFTAFFRKKFKKD